MTEDLPDRLPEEDVRTLFERMFPAGLAGPDVIDEIAPGGWEHSPLLACFHSPDFPPKPVEQDDEVAELVGCYLWDICSDNHELITPDGRPVILGSFRESAWHIANHAKRHRAGRREPEYPPC